MIDKTNKLYSIYMWKASEDGSFFLGTSLFPRVNPFEFGIGREFNSSWHPGGDDTFGPYYLYVEWLGIDSDRVKKLKSYKIWKFNLPNWLAKRLP